MHRVFYPSRQVLSHFRRTQVSLAKFSFSVQDSSISSRFRIETQVQQQQRAMSDKAKEASGEEKFPLKLSEEEWKAKLTPPEYEVLRLKGTEPAGTGEYDKFDPPGGMFVCKACEAPIYSAAAKFHSGCGWPAFDKCVKGSITTEVDTSYGMKRIEIMCSNCGGHLGHVFQGEKFTDTNERHCVNSVSIKYVADATPADVEETVADKA